MTGGLVRNWTGAASAALFLLSAPSAARQIEATDLYSLPPADIIILGEVHDNPLHHAHQAIAIGAVAPAALVWEMLTPDAAARATVDARASYGTLRTALDWDASGWPDFTLYYPLFTAAPDAAIIGADVPDADIRRAYAQGAAAVFGPDAPAYGLSAPLPDTMQRALLTELADAHCGALPADRLPAMAEVQRLRDAALARAAVTAHRSTGGPIVIIAGSGHARTDRGIPAYIGAAAPHLTVLSVGQTEAPARNDQGTDPGPQPYDLWLVTAPHPRPDPCAAFR